MAGKRVNLRIVERLLPTPNIEPKKVPAIMVEKWTFLILITIRHMRVVSVIDLQNRFRERTCFPFFHRKFHHPGKFSVIKSSTPCWWTSNLINLIVRDVAQLMCLWAGYKSFLALGQSDKAEMRQWLQFWVVYCAWCVLELFLDNILFYMPLCKSLCVVPLVRRHANAHSLLSD